MEQHIEKGIQTVISHVEGSSGNFLGILISKSTSYENTFRVDINHHHDVLWINGKDGITSNDLIKLKQHTIVVTHCFDYDTLKTMFPNASIIQINPMNFIGNILWNISHKKLVQNMPNKIDCHIIQIKEWFTTLHQYSINEANCIDYSILRSIHKIEKITGINLSQQQKTFFDNYWSRQIPIQLHSILKNNNYYSFEELIKIWGLTNSFNDWFIAFVITMYEYLNSKSENNRKWQIDNMIFNTWDDVVGLQYTSD